MKFSSSIFISNINGAKAAAQTTPMALRGGGSGDGGATAKIAATDSPSTSMNSAGSNSNTGSPSANIASSTKTKAVSDANDATDATDAAEADVANDRWFLWSKKGLRVHASTAVALIVLGDDGRPMSLQTNDNAVNVETTLKLQNSMAGNPNGLKKNCAETFDSTVIDLFFSNKNGGSVPTEKRSGDTNKVSNVT